MQNAREPMRPFAAAAKSAARALGLASTATKNAALAEIARALRVSTGAIVGANAKDLEVARAQGKNAAFIDRLLLDERRIETMAVAVEEIRGLPDPIGEVTETWRRPNGLEIRKVRLPLGLVLMIYESRPNVTSDAAALCLKSGNGAILRGGSEAIHSNRAILGAVHHGMAAAGLPSDGIVLVPSTEREQLLELIQLEGLVDLCIPRGGEGLIRFVAENARVPVVKHYKGVCHVYVHAKADLPMAERIIVNAKAQRPGVCNAAECLLVDRAVASELLPRAARALQAKGVELRGCSETVRILEAAQVSGVRQAAEEDYGREFLDLILAVKVVESLDEALAHIARYGSEHTEAIVTSDLPASQRFVREVSASAVIVNASTRFNDGGELGLGAEIGISTSRLHAFGPMGLRELTSQKYVVQGEGQVR